MNTLIRSVFSFLLGRAHRSRMAAATATLIAMSFGQVLMRKHQYAGRIIDGECRRVGN